MRGRDALNVVYERRRHAASAILLADDYQFQEHVVIEAPVEQGKPHQLLTAFRHKTTLIVDGMLNQVKPP